MLAKAVSIDMAAAYIQLCKPGSLVRGFDVLKAFHHNCVLDQKVRSQQLFTPRELGDLRMQGCAVDTLGMNCFSVAYIMGVHFRAGQWGGRTCSSVITCVIKGRSVYGRVNKFLTIDGDDCPGYASVSWFGEPRYPLGDNRLQVVVSGDGSEIDKEVGCIIRITQIDPSMIVTEPDGGDYRMMRQSGYDTVV